jgi:cellobiose phosphorylase
MGRFAREAILGLRPVGAMLRVEPCIPGRWPGYEVAYRHGSASYRIRAENPAGAGRGVQSVLVDGQSMPGGAVPL